MAIADDLKERVARLESGYEHLATKADLAQMEGRLLWRTATLMILASGVVVAAIVGLLQVI